ncbi:MAG: histidine kinase [Tunicatimonas sp.]
MPTPFHRRVFSILGFSVLIGTLIAVPFQPEAFTSWAGLQEVWPSWLMSIVYTFALSKGNGWLDYYLDRLVRWVDQPVKRLLVSILAMFVGSTLIILLIQLVFAKLIWEPRCDCTLTWSGYYLGNLYFPLVITVIATTIFNSRKFLLEWRKSAIEAARFRNEYLASQYQSLKDQMNPHFLFNSLNALTYLVYENQDQAAQFIKKLSDVYRYVLDTREREVVPVNEELAFIRAYVFLQKIRFENALRVEITIPEESTFQVPPLALQMLLENAIKHNELSEERPLQITISLEGEGYLVVQNNRQPKEIRENSSGIGLANIRARYAYLSEAEVVVLDEQPHFTVKLPLLRPELPFAQKARTASPARA